MRITKRSAVLMLGAGGMLLALGIWTLGSVSEARAQSGSPSQSRGAAGYQVQQRSGYQGRRGSGSRRDGSGSRQQRRLPPEEFHAAFWNYLTQKSPYTNWPSWPDKPGMYEGQSPHGAYLKMYVNQTAARDVERLPAKSIIVKENYAPDQKTLGAVTVMYRVEGYDPEHGDWYWIKYRPDGTVDQTPDGKPISGRFASCINCHEGSDGGDYTFAND